MHTTPSPCVVVARCQTACNLSCISPCLLCWLRAVSRIRFSTSWRGYANIPLPGVSGCRLLFSSLFSFNVSFFLSTMIWERSMLSVLPSTACWPRRGVFTRLLLSSLVVFRGNPETTARVDLSASSPSSFDFVCFVCTSFSKAAVRRPKSSSVLSVIKTRPSKENTEVSNPTVRWFSERAASSLC